MSPKDFAWTPPANAKLSQPMIELESKLLPLGSKLPDFTLKTYEGNEIKLSEYTKGKKAVLLTFYFVGCEGCIIEFPHLDKRFRKLKDKGFSVIALTPMDDDKTVRKYYSEGGFAFPTVLSKGTNLKVDEVYGALAFPTNYLIDGNMKILYRGIGENEDELTLNLRKLGIQ